MTGSKDYTAELECGELMWWDWVSPSALLGQAIEAVSEVAVWLGWLDHSFNPQEEVAKEFVGDWAGARAAADILRDVGRSVTDTALNVQWAAQGIDQVWQGNAADGATGYLVHLARRLDVDNAWPPIDTLAQQYEGASADMVNLRDAAVGVINSISDAAAEAAVACGVAGGAASTGVGAPVAALAALYAGSRIMRVVTGVQNLRDVVSELATVTSALKAAQDGFAGPGRVSLPTLPAAPIDTPR